MRYQYLAEMFLGILGIQPCSNLADVAGQGVLLFESVGCQNPQPWLDKRPHIDYASAGFHLMLYSLTLEEP